MATHLIDSQDLLDEELKTNPEFKERWERTALARAVAIAVVRYRSEHHLSQRALAKQLGMPYSQISRLELGEHNPSVDLLERIAAGLGQRFTISVGPAEKSDRATLPMGSQVLVDIVLPDGVRVLASAD
jgi:ribosome-binding protein aMBF1 (putative translation factor)